MGDRALIQLYKKGGDGKGEFSPVLYLHHGGSDVGDIIKRTMEQMRGRSGDVPYAFARLVQQACGDDTGNLSIGVWNAEEPLNCEASHGDAGCFLCEVSGEAWTVSVGGGYGFDGNPIPGIVVDALA